MDYKNFLYIYIFDYFLINLVEFIIFNHKCVSKYFYSI